MNPGINPPQDEFVNHKGYNSLTVGSHDDTVHAIAGTSVFRNPTTAHGDRELPELAANGEGVSAVGETMSGTSFAAPAVAGIVALLQEANRGLGNWPEACRAILMAAPPPPYNVHGGTWWQDVQNNIDARDGAGAVQAFQAVLIARERTEPGAAATRRGWHGGTLSSADVGPDNIATFRYQAAVYLLRNPTLKVALAWNSSVASSGNGPTASTLTVDLDLVIRDSTGAAVVASASFDNSYEIVEFDAREGETYDILIRRWSGTDAVWYGIAWATSGFPIF